jgi:hypothetical protein
MLLLSRFTDTMDSEISLFQGTLDASAGIQNLPPRCLTPMAAQPVVPWTFARLIAAFSTWLLAETLVPAPARTDA